MAQTQDTSWRIFVDVLLQHFLSIKMFNANNFLSLVASDCPLLAYIWCKTSFGILWQFLKDHETIWSQTGAIQHSNSLNDRMAGPSQFFYFLLFFQLHIIIYKVYFLICPTAIEMMYVAIYLFAFLLCFSDKRVGAILGKQNQRSKTATH